MVPDQMVISLAPIMSEIHVSDIEIEADKGINGLIHWDSPFDVNLQLDPINA